MLLKYIDGPLIHNMESLYINTHPLIYYMTSREEVQSAGHVSTINIQSCDEKTEPRRLVLILH